MMTVRSELRLLLFRYREVTLEQIQWSEKGTNKHACIDHELSVLVQKVWVLVVSRPPYSRSFLQGR